MAYKHETDRRKKARALITRTGHKAGGHLTRHRDEDHAEDASMIRDAIHQHDRQLHPGHTTKLKLADGGTAAGHEAAGRADRPSRGHKGAGHGSRVNILVAPQGKDRPVPVPVPAGGAPGPGGPPPMPPRPAMPPPGMPPMGMGGPPPMPPGAAPMRPGMPGPGAPLPPGAPMMRKHGGRTGHSSKIAREAREEHESYAEEAREHRARGGRTPHMTAGSGSGEGRLQKSRALDYCAGGKA